MPLLPAFGRKKKQLTESTFAAKPQNENREETMKKTCMLVLTGLMTASLAASIGLTTVSASALDVGTADENGWVQNANMDPITINEEGASVLTTTAGSVTTYNTTALDLTKSNKLVLRSEAKDSGWLCMYLVDDYSQVLSKSQTDIWTPGNADFVKVAGLLDKSSMLVSCGYSSKLIGTSAGAPSDLSQYTTVEFYIGTGAENDASYIKINGTEVVGENGEKLTVTRDAFKDSKAYIALQPMNLRSIYTMAPNEDPVMLEGAEFIPMGTGSSENAGFMLNKTMENIPAEGYQITADKAVNNVLVNGKTLAEAGAMLYVLEGEVDGLGKIQSLGLLPAAGNEAGFSWKVGDTITFLEGFTIYDSTGKALWDLKRDFGFYVNSVAEDGSCTFAAQIGLSWNGADRNFVNLNLTYAVNAAATVAQENVTAITLNGAPLSENGYFNLATPTIIQLLKNEGNWEWKEGDTIYIPYGFTFKDSSNYTYAIDANYTLTYGASGFTLTRTEAGAARPVSVQSMQLGHFDAANNLYGMQIVFAENVRGDIEENADIVGEAWFNTFVKVNGKTLAEIRQIQVGTDAEDKPIYATVRANFEKENTVTLWIDGRASVVEAGDNKLGAGTVVTILPGIEFPSGYVTKEEQSFEWTGDVWQVTVAVDQFELTLEDGQTHTGGIEAGTKNAYINMPAPLSSLTSIASFPIESSMEVKEHVMFNGQLLSQMTTAAPIIQVNNANTLQVQVSQGSWAVGDRLVLLKGMPLYNDIPSSPNAQKVAELAHNYIFDCTSGGTGELQLALRRRDGRRTAADVMRDGLFQQFPAHEPEQRRKELSARRAVHHDELHEIVVHLRDGTERDPPAELPAVADGGDHGVIFPRFALRRDDELCAAVAEERGEEAAEILPPPAAVTHVFAAAEDLHVHARARDVEGTVGAAFDVVRVLRLRIQDHVDRRGAERDLCCGGKIVARSRGDDAQRDRAGIRNAAEYFVYDTVSPHDDELRLPRGSQAARVFAGVTALGGIEKTAGNAAVSALRIDLGNQFFEFSDLRVDDDVEHIPSSPLGNYGTMSIIQYFVRNCNFFANLIY